MSAEPKRVELTEAEQQQTDRDHLADLIHDAVNAGGDDLTFDVAYSIAGCIVGSEWLKEHVIAAEQAGREDNALHDMCYVSGSKALEAREAAAREEALLEAEGKHRAEVDAERRAWVAADKRAGFQQERAEKAEAKVARVEALADELETECPSSSAWRGAYRNNAKRIRAALAEPERDEEGGND